MLYKNYIDGQWVDSATGKTFKSLNPADTSDELGEFPSSNAQDVERAVQAADRAFREWSKVPAPKRGELLFEIGERLKRQKEDLAQIMTREMGKVLKEARGDVQEAIDMAYYIAAEGRRLFGYTTPSELPLKHCISFRRPVGVVGVITPWNFPVAIPAWKIFRRSSRATLSSGSRRRIRRAARTSS
jgi:acyl-CoA reductase-like NAD-dependent aldehyde dehydrogenase